jgi:hypothetical protein
VHPATTRHLSRHRAHDGLVSADATLYWQRLARLEELAQQRVAVADLGGAQRPPVAVVLVLAEEE